MNEMSDRKEFDMVMPWPSTVNHYHQPIIAKNKDGMPYAMATISAGARKYKKLIVATVKDKIGTLSEPMFWEVIAVSLYFFPPDVRKRDIDNYPKGVFDGMVAAYILEDDSLIKECHSYWCEKVSFTTHPKLHMKGCVMVRVWPIPNWEPMTYNEVVNYQTQNRLF